MAARFYNQTSTREEEDMTWSAPCVTEVCVGMEVTSYESAEI
jgi:coenzyme PQQ precursor peptide PqqA